MSVFICSESSSIALNWGTNNKTFLLFLSLLKIVNSDKADRINTTDVFISEKELIDVRESLNIELKRLLNEWKPKPGARIVYVIEGKEYLLNTRYDSDRNIKDLNLLQNIIDGSIAFNKQLKMYAIPTLSDSERIIISHLKDRQLMSVEELILDINLPDHVINKSLVDLEDKLLIVFSIREKSKFVRLSQKSKDIF